MKNTEQQLPLGEMKELQQFIDYIIKKKLYTTKDAIDRAFRFHEADKALPFEDFLCAAVMSMYSKDPELFSDYVSKNIYFFMPFVTPLMECNWDHKDPRLAESFTLYRFSLTSAAHFYFIDTPPFTSNFDRGVWAFSEQINDQHMINTFESDSTHAYYAGGHLNDDDIDGDLSFKRL